MKRIILFLLMTILCLGGCSNSSDTTLSDGDYEVISESYKQGEIDVKYPQIKGLEDSKKEEKINKLIKNTLFELEIDKGVKEAKEFTELNGIEDAYYLSLDYEVTLMSNSIISILYEGISSFRTSSHPSYVVYGITIDLKKTKEMSLSDFIDVDDTFIKKLKTSKKVTNSVIEAKGAKMTKKDLLTIIPECITVREDIIKRGLLGEVETTNTFAIKPESLLISVVVYHAAGDYAIIEIPYEYKEK